MADFAEQGDLSPEREKNIISSQLAGARPLQNETFPEHAREAEANLKLLRGNLYKRISNYGQEQGFSNERLKSCLQSVWNRLNSLHTIQVLEEAFFNVRIGEERAHAILASFSKLTRDSSARAAVSAEHLLIYTDTVQFLESLKPAPSKNTLKSFAKDANEFLRVSSSSKQFELYLNLIISEGISFGFLEDLPMDLFGEAETYRQTFLSESPEEADWNFVISAMKARRAHLSPSSDLVEGYKELRTSLFGQDSEIADPQLNALAGTYMAGLGSSAANDEFKLTLYYASRKGSLSKVAPLIRGLATLLSEEKSEIVIRSYWEKLREKLGESLDEQSLVNLGLAIEKGVVVNPAQFFKRIEDIEFVEAARRLSIPDRKRQRAQDISAFLGLAQPRSSEIAEVLKVAPQAIQINPKYLILREKAHDISKGFSSLLFPFRRTSTREPPELARFGSDLGKVKYINARDIASFPGRGFLINSLNLEKIFAADLSKTQRGADPFGEYKIAWPRFKEEFDRLGKAEFLFTRGFLVISCKDKDLFTVQFRNGERAQMCVIIFNDHFQNPHNRLAYLVPVRFIQKLIAGTLIPFEDYTGYSTSHKDINQVVGSPDSFLNALLARGLAVDLADPTRIVSGFPELRDELPSGFEMPNELTIEHFERTQKLNARIRSFNKKGNAFKFTTAGRSEWRSMAAEKRAIDEINEDLAQKNRHLNRVSLEEMFKDRINQQHQGWVVLQRLFNLYDLFLISHSLWHKGYTLGTGSDSSSASGTPSTEMERDNSGGIYWNRNSTRMLDLAYEWHNQSALGIQDKNQYPILIVTETLRQGDVGKITAAVDTYTMKAHLDNQTYQFQEEQMSLEDEHFWRTEFLPRAEDKPGVLFDMRFCPRTSIGFLS